jgi:hypothetical protein
VVACELATCDTVSAATSWFAARAVPTAARVALGVDTLTVWSTGPCGWRPADRALRQKYTSAKNSVVSSNSLYGAMAVNGMMLMTRLRELLPNLLISETHPKVLYTALMSRSYDYDANASDMNLALAEWLGSPGPSPRSEHEWDAVVSAYAMAQGLTSRWSADLHELPTQGEEVLVWPVGKTRFYWPSALGLPPL